MKPLNLLPRLKLIAPAIGSKDIVPVLPCVCFNGDYMYGFDDTVAIATASPVKLEGAVPGQLLIDWLSEAPAKEMTIEPDPEKKGSGLVIKVGRAKLKLALMPKTSFIFERPDLGKAKSFQMTDKAVKALKRAAISMGTDPGHPWRMGVTIAFEEGGKITFFADDNVTVSRATIKAKFDEKLVGKAFILPPRFCELLIERVDNKTVLRFTKEWLGAEFPECTLYSRALSEVNLSTFKGLFSDLDEYRGKAVPLPGVFHGMLTRAQIVLKTASDTMSDLKIKDGKLTILTRGKTGEDRSTATLKGKHEQVDAKLLPELVLRGLEHVDKMIVTGGSRLCLFGEGFDYLVSVSGA